MEKDMTEDINTLGPDKMASWDKDTTYLDPNFTEK